MKILHTADWHLKAKHKYTKPVEGKVWDELFEEKMKILNLLPRVIQKYDCDSVVISGDLFDNTNPNTSIKAEVCKLINKFINLKVSTYIIPGNHETSSFGNNVLMDLAKAYGVSERIYIYHSDTDNLSIDAKIGVFHVMMEGIDPRFNKGIVEYSDERFKNCNTILLGDYHAFYQRHFGKKFFTYPGPPYPTRLGEHGNSVSIIDVDDDGNFLNLKKVRLPSYSFIEIKHTFKEGDEIDLDIFSDKKYIVKCIVYCSADSMKTAFMKFKDVKEKWLNEEKCLDFDYIVKTKTLSNSEQIDIQKKTVKEVAIEHIEKNAPYPNATKKLFNTYIGGV